MAVTAAQVKLFRSTNGLGGAVTSTEILSATLHNLFDIVSAAESRDGDIEYRCFYIRNTSTVDTFRNVAIQLLSDTPSEDTSIAIGLGSAAIGAPEQTIADEGTAPIGISFTADEQVPLTIGDIPPNSYKAVWVRRTVEAATAAASSDAATLRITGETTA